MSGMIGVIADSAGRYTQFYQCLSNLRKPVDTKVEFAIGSDRATSRNDLVQLSLKRGSEWIFLVDDDQAFPPTLLLRMLQHDQPVISALYTQRGAPFLPIAFARKEDGLFWPLDLREHGPDELVQVVGCGGGGLLVRSEVFRKLGEIPWFVHTTEKSEDLYFCDLCTDASIPIYVDTGARLGHIAPAVVFPAWSEDEGNERWVTGIQFSHTTSIALEMDYDAELDKSTA